MYLVVGLGNHVLKGTRHNMGMLCLDNILSKTNKVWTKRNDLDGYICETPTINYFKSTKYMNVCGKSIKKALEYYKLPISSLIVVHDDLDRKLGKLSKKVGGSASGHNGIKSIISSLNSSDFSRIRVGIGRPENVAQVPDFVLTKFSQDELEMIEKDVYPKFEEILNHMLD